VGASIPSSKVNDGICELACCDGSDEAPGLCPNTCREIAAQKAKERAAWRQVVEEGMAKKKEYMRDASAMMEARYKELASLQAQKVGLEKKVADARIEKESEEGKEKVKRDEAMEQAATTLISGLKIESLGQEELVSLHRKLKGRPGKALRRVLEEIRGKAGIEEVEGEEEGEGGEQRPLSDIAAKEEMEKKMKEVKEGTFHDHLGPVPAEDEDEDAEGDEDDDEEIEDDDYSPPNAAQEPLDPALVSLLEAAEEGLDEPSAGAEAARQALKDARDEERTVRERIQEMEAESQDDYGDGYAFYLLRGKCFSKTVNKYRYEMCPYKEAQQVEGSAARGTSLGKWGGMEQSNGTVAGGSSFKFLFRKGQQCWNGPERSLTVTVECGVEDQVVSVEEPSMCEYAMTFKTPAACSPALLEWDDQEAAGREAFHSEL